MGGSTHQARSRVPVTSVPFARIGGEFGQLVTRMTGPVSGTRAVAVSASS